MMQRVLCAALVAAVLTGLVGCGASGPTPAKEAGVVPPKGKPSGVVVPPPPPPPKK